MASSTAAEPTVGFDEATLQEVLSRLPQPKAWLVAYSGGLDSSVLLHAMARLRGRLGLPLRAIHIHHGLLPHADTWSEHCRGVCKRLGVPLDIVRLALRVPPGESLEAAAREARYAAIAEHLGRREMLLTAQHQDDQAETLILQLLRGAGIEGLAGMPRCQVWASGWHARPLLDCPRTALRQWAEAEGIDWIEDPSNQDTQYDRNYLRHRVMPLLKARWPGASRTIARSTDHLAESLSIVREEARADLEACRAGAELSLDDLFLLPPARRRMVIRAWVSERGYPVPDQRRMHTIEAQLEYAAQDSSPCIDWAGVSLRRYRNRLYLTPKPLPPVPQGQLAWVEPECLPLPAGCGELSLTPARAGISRHAWPEGRVTVRWPQAGQRFQLRGRAGRRSLKKLCQEWGVPPWVRPYLPLVYVDGQVAAIGGYALCAGIDTGTEPCLSPVWNGLN